MDIAHVHQNIIKGFLLKCKSEFTETFFILAKFAKNVECLLGGITDNLVHRVSLRLSSLGRRKGCAAVVIFLQGLFEQFFKSFCGKLIGILILCNASTQHFNEHFKASGRQLNPVELFDKARAEYAFFYVRIKYAHHTVAQQCFSNHALYHTIHALRIVLLARCLMNVSGNAHKALRQRQLFVVQNV